MNRRTFLRRLTAASSLALLGGQTDLHAEPDPSAPLVLSLQLSGGLDARASFDPLSVGGGGTQGRFDASEVFETHGLQVAPALRSVVEANAEDIRVLTGIDCLRQPPHSRRHMNTGRYEPGYPHICALHAAGTAPDAAIPFLDYAPKSDGATAGLCSVVRKIPLEGFANLADPALKTQADEPMITPQLRALVSEARRAGYERASDAAGLRSRGLRAEQLHAGLDRIAGLEQIEQFLPSPSELGGSMSDAEQDARIVLGAMASGRVPAAQIEMIGFDTHGKNATPMVDELAELLTVIFDEAERLGLWDRLIVLGVTEFTRIGRPDRSTSGGTNHHDTTTAFVLKRGINADRRGLIGRTDDDAAGIGLDPETLDVSEGGVVPTYVDYMQMIRQLLDVPASLDQRFPLDVERLGNPGLLNPFMTA